MAKSAIQFSATHPLDEFLSRYQAGPKSAGVHIEDRRDRGIVQIFAIKGKTRAVERALKITSTPGKSTRTRDYSALPVSRGQWMLVSNKTLDNFAVTITKKLKGIGHVSEQADSRVILRVSGANARMVLQKGCRLDLHPSVTTSGFCGQTSMAQIGVSIHQIDDKPTYDLMVYSGFARDFAEWLAHSAAEYGLRFTNSAE